MTLAGRDDTPVYLRLRSMIADSIMGGTFGTGGQLPSVRAFAAQTGTNPLTVAKAYQSLQDDGFVIVKRGVGMFVAADAAPRLLAQERDYFLNDIWPDIRQKIEQLGLSVDELMDTEQA